MIIEYRASSYSQLWETNSVACISAIGTVVWVTGQGYVGGNLCCLEKKFPNFKAPVARRIVALFLSPALRSCIIIMEI